MLTALLSKAHLQTITYPRVAFRAANFSEDFGFEACSPMRLHDERAAEYVDTAASMFQDAQDYLHLHEFFRSSLSTPLCGLDSTPSDPLRVPVEHGLAVGSGVEFQVEDARSRRLTI